MIVNGATPLSDLPYAAVRPAEPTDIPGLVALSTSFSLPQVGLDRAFGYLLRLPSPEGWEQLIASNNVVVASNGEAVVGFYSVDHYGVLRDAPKLQALARRRQQIIRNLDLSETAVSFGAQNCIARDYQGRGLRQQLLSALIALLAGRYDHLFSVIMQDNQKSLNGNGRDGWRTIEMESGANYVLLTIKDILADSTLIPAFVPK